MLVKDQLKIRMDQLGMSVNELAKRVGVSSQSVRHWLGGRSFPAKSKCNLIEEALTFKLDFSEGESAQSITVEQTLKQTSINTLISISRLSLKNQLLLAKLVDAMLELQQGAKTEQATPYQLPVAKQPPKMPPRPAKNVSAVGRVVRTKVVEKAAGLKEFV